MAMNVSVDIGGTFTDCVVQHEHGVEFYKAPTTPADPVRGMLDAIGKAAKRVTRRSTDTSDGSSASFTAPRLARIALDRPG